MKQRNSIYQNQNTLNNQKANCFGTLQNLSFKQKDIKKKQTKNQVPAKMQQIKLQTFENLQFVVLQYKLSVQYGPILGVYILPKVEDFFIWEVYFFLRQGYYKDSKLKLQIHFNKQGQNRVNRIFFVSTVFHPLVQLKRGDIDMERLDFNMSDRLSNNSVFSLILKLKQMFQNDKWFTLEGSFNPEAARTYKKSETSFIEKVFETTVIPSEHSHQEQIVLNRQFQLQAQEQVQVEQQDQNKRQSQIQYLRNRLQQICPGSTKSFDILETTQDKGKQDSIQSKVDRYLQVLMG